MASRSRMTYDVLMIGSVRGKTIIKDPLTWVDELVGSWDSGDSLGRDEVLAAVVD